MRKLPSALGILVIVTFSNRCNEVTGPDLTPTPSATPAPVVTSTAAPVVTSVEPDFYADYQWRIHGRNFKPNPIATLESSGWTINLRILYSHPNGAVITVHTASLLKPGTYSPCVITRYGKGCGSGSSLITLK